MKKLIRVDMCGRILIPYRVRKYCNISVNDILLLSTMDNGFKLVKEINSKDYDRIIAKLISIENSSNISFLLLGEGLVIYTSNNYKKLRNSLIDIDKIIDSLDSNVYKTRVISFARENLKLFLIYRNEDEKLVQLVDIAFA